MLNYNGQKHLKKFLPSVVEYTPAYLADIIVADNASTDGSVDWVKENYPQVKTMVFEKNFGFADGYNIAIGRVKTPYVVLLNTDVEYLATGKSLPPSPSPAPIVVNLVKHEDRIVEVEKIVEKPVVKRVIRMKYRRNPLEYIVLGIVCLVIGFLLGWIC